MSDVYFVQRVLIANIIMINHRMMLQRPKVGEKLFLCAFVWCNTINQQLFMVTSSNGNIFRVTGEFPTQRPVTQSFDVFCHLLLDIQLSKQAWGWWFETLSHPLWRHCNVQFWMDAQYTKQPTMTEAKNPLYHVGLPIKAQRYCKDILYILDILVVVFLFLFFQIKGFTKDSPYGVFREFKVWTKL